MSFDQPVIQWSSELASSIAANKAINGALLSTGFIACRAASKLIGQNVLVMAGSAWVSGERYTGSHIHQKLALSDRLRHVVRSLDLATYICSHGQMMLS